MEKRKFTDLPPDYDDVPVLLINPKKHRASCSRALASLILLVLSSICLAGGLYFMYQSHTVQSDDTKPNQYKGPLHVFQTVYIKYWSKYTIRKTVNEFNNDKCSVETFDKLDCYPGGGASQKACLDRGCCWVPADENVADTPWCYYPQPESQGYRVSKMSPSSLGRRDKTRWPKDVMTIQMDTMEETPTRFHFKIFDPNNKRFEVPIETPHVTQKSSNNNYKATLNNHVFGIKVTRTDKSAMTLFDTNGTQLTYSDQFIEMTTALPTNYIYGLGEHRDRLLHNVSQGFNLAIWARDAAPAGCVNCNLYGQHPFFIGLDDKTKTAYGVFLLNSNAMEVTATPASGSMPAQLTYRTTGGILDFYIFTGPSPGDVVQQYLGVIGLPYMPPYWGLGFHLCRYGYNSTDKMKEVIQRMRDQGFPYDTQWNDIDYMDNHYDWTYDTKRFSDLPAVVDDLHSHNQHYMMIVDPGIPNKPGYSVYDEGVKDGVFLMYADKDEPIIGQVWPGTTAYPDFFNPVTKQWWLKQAQKYHSKIPFDGLWTDMNEPSNFATGSIEGCTNSSYDNPPFTPSVIGGSLIDKTVCPSARHKDGVHYNLHSMYGHSELIASQMALHELRPGKRTIVISRSTFPSSGRYAGHWTGDNASTWDDLKYSISGILNFGFFGIPFVGADVCGFGEATNGELCVRWTQLGAFYPFMRNHNMINSPDQDPAAGMFNSDEKSAMMIALNTRYTILPYLYTLLARAHMNGTMVAKPLWAEFPDDVMTYPNDRQYMLGESMMAAPVLDQGVSSYKVYLPRGSWLSFQGELVKSSGEEKDIKVSLNTIGGYLREGSIIPTAKVAKTTVDSRQEPLTFIAVLDSTGQACGSLYWDDGETLNATEHGEYNMIYFTIKDQKLTSSIVNSGYNGDTLVDVMAVGNLPENKLITSYTVNGKEMTAVQCLLENYCTMSLGTVDLTKPLTIEWSY